jgi:tRNA modification GTPase
MLHDTIAAISTPLGEGGIAVIRISGDDAIAVADRVFKGKRPLSKAATHTVHYGFIVDPGTGERIDEALVTVMRAPRSFTMEDVVEVGCHGGIVAVRRVLEVLLANGARLAEPGEFTKRAFLNGRIDLTQAEAVIDLIRSKSDRASALALKQVEGKLADKIKALRETLVTLMAHIEVNIDYPEHDVEEMTNEYIKNTCQGLLEEIERLLAWSEQGKVLREGIVTAIVGKPNVGKSSLLNTLIRENKAIVTDIPGTTRDVIEEYITIKGIPLRLLDTAGIRDTSDVVEKIGVEKSKSALAEADLILLVLNYNEPLTEDELSLIEQIGEKQTIVVVNKTDLPQRLDVDYVRSRFEEDRIIMISVKSGHGLEQLEDAISRMFFRGDIEGDDLTYVSNIRHIQLLKQAKRSLEEALAGAEQWMPIDMVQIDLRNAWEHLGEIIGDAVSESLIDQIFSKFCLGK